jgi:hypothetical protein
VYGQITPTTWAYDRTKPNPLFTKYAVLQIATTREHDQDSKRTKKYTGDEAEPSGILAGAYHAGQKD